MSRVITFYSYKGGTGRSMALANIAWVLASAGKRVLTIDWDLEAPGLHRYFQPFLSDKELNGQQSQGVIDMAIDFAVRAATPPKPGEKRDSAWYDAQADFSKWRQKLRWPSGEAIGLGADHKGEIDFVPAGRQGADYAKRVNHFDWHNFYEMLGGGAFFDAAKRKFAAYDYVLIDSRTGVSDTSGICTVHMPDILVVCFTLNYQSIKGALAVAQSVRKQRPDIRIFPVPMRIDASETPLLNRMKTYAAGVFRPLLDSRVDATDYWYLMEVPYFARYAYAEKLTLFEERASITASTLPAMERLSGYLTDGAVAKAGPLPETERKLALAEFEADATAKPRVANQPPDRASFPDRLRAAVGRTAYAFSTPRTFAVAVSLTFVAFTVLLLFFQLNLQRAQANLEMAQVSSVEMNRRAQAAEEELRRAQEQIRQQLEIINRLSTGNAISSAIADPANAAFTVSIHYDPSDEFSARFLPSAKDAIEQAHFKLDLTRENLTAGNLRIEYFRDSQDPTGQSQRAAAGRVALILNSVLSGTEPGHGNFAIKSREDVAQPDHPRLGVYF
ncbi:KGGVGR-motif variant AAA ATPase [Mesorhizobium kowhaii]|uniref:KGGVGR-motif variant AAA ATPase n=1 Tax=Mesorhizobium kowhaii TaxID=1300272 RepID=UPI0035E8D571